MKTKTLLISAFVLVAVLLSACTNTSNTNTPVRSLNATGTGIVTIKPDVAYINIGVHTESATAAEATAQNNKDADAVIKAIKAAGVADDDIQTNNFSIYQNYQTDPTTGARLSTTYVVDNTVAVTVRDLTKLGTILDASVKAGANTVNSIQFDLLDKTQALADARTKAVKAAREQADALASAAGVTLVNIQTINTSENTPGPILYAKSFGGGFADAAASVPTSGGTLEISVTASLTYEIK